MEKINVVCVKWGSLYSSEYVNRLYSMVKRNLTIEFDFYCITEDTSNVRPEVICISSPVTWLENQWYKETMFLKGTIPERITLYLDLDVVVVSSLDKLIPKDDSLWCMGRDFINYEPPRFHGAVMVFNPKYWYDFFDFFKQELKSGLKMIRGKEQPLIAKYHKQNSYKNFKVYPNEWIWSFKYGHLRDDINVENAYIYRGYKPPENGIICSFHGWPNVDQILELEYIDKNSVKWIEDNWTC
jgi:lipopolysaccharide biosynthesis glycosyltransferase